jgi:group II intron reverse transcriptase/maturase
MMHEHGKSDSPIVPTKRPNKDAASRQRSDGEPYTGTKVETPDTAKGEPKAKRAETLATAEAVEGRGLAKGNPRPQTTPQAQDWLFGVHSARARVRKAARGDKQLRFTTLLHHVYDVTALREAYFSLKRQAAAGVDGVTWRQYGEDLEGNLRDLSGRLKRGAYRAKPVRRAYIPKADGRQRPLGVTTLEDKLVQRAVVDVLNAIYEVDFLGFSYGFRPERTAHHALDALSVGLLRKKVNWVLDADIRGFFDAISHEWLVKFVEHRIADKRVVRLIQKWLNAGVLEDGKRTQVEVGTPQGGSVSPLLANIYLHYVFDLWADQWRQKDANGEVIIVRYADDFVVGFESESDAKRFLVKLRERLAKFGLELHADKTRLIEFGRYAVSNRNRRGDGKPETFDFLGFTHMCGQSRRGKFRVKRKTIRKRMRAKLQEVKAALQRRMHRPIPETGQWLSTVVRGHFQYYAVPWNTPSLNSFRDEVTRLWRHTLSRRSQKGAITWERMHRLAQRWLPPVRIYHAYPTQRLVVRTCGRSPVR